MTGPGVSDARTALDGGMSLAEAMDVFDMSAQRTTPNRQTEAWAVIRAKLREAAAPAAAGGEGVG